MRCYRFVIFLNIVYIIQEGSGQSHAFIQIDNEIKYLVDGIPVQMNDVLNEDQNLRHDSLYDDRIISKNFLIFDPPFLDFKEHPTGMPLMKKVIVHNTSPDMSIHLHSLSGNTMHFHCTFFQDKVIIPGGNTSFDVVFLGREEGFIENTIYVHTSIGTYRYWVKAIGTPNPYRVRPLIGVRMPLNSSYTPYLQVHNPHSKNLQIKEMYSTGGDLHLELADNLQDNEGHQWSIQPYHTKALMRATFVARRDNNHTAYIRIVPKMPISDYIVIPIEVEVSSEQGLFFPSDSLYFGLLTPHDPPVTVPLFLLNSAPKHIHIQNIITSTVNEAISIDFKPIKIAPGTVHPTQVATVTFNPSKINNGVKVSGKLLVKSKISAYKLSIPFSVDLHQGSLEYNSSVTRFFSGSEYDTNSTVESIMSGGTSGLPIKDFDAISTSGVTSTSSSHPSFTSPSKFNREPPHDLILKNTFKFPVVVHNITVPDAALPHFKVKWVGPVLLKQEGSAKVAELSLLSDKSDLRFTVNITIHTNITSVNIPLIAYNGKLTKYTSSSGSEKWLDFGTVGMGEQHDNYFYILNENPVDIRIQGWGSTLSHTAVELMGIVEGNFSEIIKNPNRSYSTKSLFLKPNHFAVFRIGILTPSSEGIYLAESYVQTQYEVIRLPFRLRTADGLLSIFPKTLLFEDSFPSKISEQELHILSTFGHSMTVESIIPKSGDHRLAYIPPSSSNPQPVLHPYHQSHIGKIVFNPQKDCKPDCYTGFSLHSKVGQQWISSFTLTPHVGDIDGSLYTKLRHRYEKLPSHSLNMAILLDTSEVKGHKFNAKINFVWPHFVNIREVNFPLTQVYNTTYEDFTIVNPASQPVVAQVLFLHYYPATVPILPILQEQIKNGSYSWDSWNGNSQEAFSFLDLDSSVNCNACGGATDQVQDSYMNFAHYTEDNLSLYFAQNRRTFESHYKTRVAKDSLPVHLESLAQVKIRLSFTPLDEKPYSTLILLRNNLTVIEAILVKGQGGRGQINFKKTLAKSTTQFHFSVQDKYLKNCSMSSSAISHSSLYTLRQTFLAENNGELPIHLYDFHIGDVPCQSYGFKVTNCSSFTLHPNQSHRIEIAFTPDYSLYQVEQFLIIRTSLTGISSHLSHKRENITIDPSGNVVLRLVATVSSHAVAKCGDKVPRPRWEPLLYYSVITLLVGMCVGTIIRAILEAEHILKITFISMTTLLPTNQPIPVFDKSKVFDLRAMSMQEMNCPTSNITWVSSTLQDSKVSQVPSKFKSHLNIADQSKRPISLSNSWPHSNSGTPSTNINTPSSSKSKLEKLCNSNFINRKNSAPSQATKKPSNYSQNSIKMPLRLSTLFSLPFGIKKSNGSSSSNTSNVKQSSRTRKNSSKEVVSLDYNCCPDTKAQNDVEVSSTATESSSSDEILFYLKENYSTSPYEQHSQKRKKSYLVNNNNTNNSNNHNNNNFNNKNLSNCKKNQNLNNSNTNNTTNNNVTKNHINPNKNSSDKINESKKKNNSNSNSNNTCPDNIFPIKLNAIQNKDRDTGFEIRTKCKGIKKIKETSKKHSSILELPYTLKPVKSVDSAESGRERSNSKLKNKNATLEKSKVVAINNKPDEHKAPESAKSAPAKAVVAPTSRIVPQNQPLAPRDPSYSSIVLGNTKQAKVTPVGKIIPEVKKIEKPLGVIGQKIPSTSSGVFHHSLKSPLLESRPITNSDPLHRHNQALYSNSLTASPPPHISTPQAVSSHSWDPKTLSSPSSAPPLNVGPIRQSSAMSDEDWLPFGAPNFPSVWSDGETGSMDKVISTAPPSSLWESQNSFSIWSSPWNTDQSPLVSSPLVGSGCSLWQAQTTYDIAPRSPSVGLLETLTDSSRSKEED